MSSLLANEDFIRTVQEFSALQAVTGSSVRGLKRRGECLRIIRAYLGRLRLDGLAGMDGSDYTRWLDRSTRVLEQKLPAGDRQWGVARKVINLFMRQCLYNTYLSRKYGLARLQKDMEIPLDSRVFQGLKRDAGRGTLSGQPRLKELDKEASERFQEHARDLASRKGLPGRVFLDNLLLLGES